MVMGGLTWFGWKRAPMQRLADYVSRRHLVLWAITVLSCLVSFVFIGVSCYFFLKAPSHIIDQPYWSALKDIGPAIGASWVFSAALLTITAAGITAIASLNDSGSQSEARRRAITRICVGEIKAFWDRCNSLELDHKLRVHIAWLKIQTKVRTISSFFEEISVTTGLCSFALTRKLWANWMKRSVPDTSRFPLVADISYPG